MRGRKPETRPPVRPEEAQSTVSKGTPGTVKTRSAAHPFALRRRKAPSRRARCSINGGRPPDRPNYAARRNAGGRVLPISATW